MVLHLLELYQQAYPNTIPKIKAYQEEIDLEFLIQDIQNLLQSMQIGTERIRKIVLSLRNFSRLDEAELKLADINEGIDSTLLILQNCLKKNNATLAIQVIKEYGKLPLIYCFSGALNQVFMNLLNNAIDAIEDLKLSNNFKSSTPSIRIQTEVKNEKSVIIKIADNGLGISQEVLSKIFDPFFTTKPVGQGTGLGLSISHQIIVDQHSGQLTCTSVPNQGTEFVVEIPIKSTTMS